jgi:hypothetical protein
VIEKKASILESLERRFGDKPVAVEPTEKRSTNNNVIGVVVGGGPIEVFGRGGARILSDDEASQGSRQPAAFHVFRVPGMIRGTTTG